MRRRQRRHGTDSLAPAGGGGAADASTRDWRLQRTACAEAARGAPEVAVATALRLGDSALRDWTLKNIGTSLAARGQEEAAFEAIRHIRDAGRRDWGFGQAASLMDDLPPGSKENPRCCDAMGDPGNGF